MCRAVVVFAFLLVSCGNPLAADPTPTPTCAQLAAPALAQLQSIAREWDDASKLAGQTPRSALSGQIAALQATRRKVQDLAVPGCADAVKTALTRSMDATIDTFIAFLGQRPDTEVQAGFRDADQKMQAFTAELAKLNGVAPPSPAPTNAPVVGLASAVELIKAYEQADITFQNSPLADGTPRAMGTGSNGLVTIEIIGPKENPKQASLFLSVGSFDQSMIDAGQGTMITFARAIMPDWNEADTWIKQAIKTAGAKPETETSVVVGGRLVTVKRSGTGSDQTLSIEMKLK